MDDTEYDLGFLCGYCDLATWKVVTWGTDVGEADYAAQPSLRSLIKQAAQEQRPFDAILVSDVMRIADGMSPILQIVDELDRLGIEFISLGRSLTKPAHLEMSYVTFRALAAGPKAYWTQQLH